MSSAIKLASEVAQLLERDLVLAAQIKNHIPYPRLREILGLEQESCHHSTPPFEGPSSETEEALAPIIERFPLETVLAAYRKAGKT